MEAVSSAFEGYSDIVYHNAELITQFESVIQNLLPFFVTRFQRESIVKTEIYYSFFSLVAIVHDGIILRKRRENLTEDIINYTRKKEVVLPEWWENSAMALHSINGIQILIEVIAMGKKKRWFAIFMVEFLKMSIRLYLLVRCKGAILVKQTVPARELIVVPPNEKDQNKEEENNTAKKKRTTLLDVIEKENKFQHLDSNWMEYWNRQPYRIPQNREEFIEKYIPSPPTLISIFAELIFILRPLLYVMMIITYGKNKWKPWIYSLFIELYCYYLFKKNKKRNQLESEEGSRRLFLFFQYFARSPFFDKILCPLVERVPVPGIIRSNGTISHLYSSVKETIHTYQQYFFCTSP